MRLVVHVLVAFLLLGFVPSTTAQEEKPVSISGLRKRARASLAALKKNPDPEKVRDVLALVERLRAKQKKSEALRYLKDLVKCAPDDADALLAYAEMLNETSRRARDEQEVTRIVRRILREGETDRLQVGAAHLIGEKPNLTLLPLDRPLDGKPHVVLLPMGAIEVTLLKALRDELARKLPVDVMLRRVDLDIQAPDRSRFEPFFLQVKCNLQSLLDDVREPARNTCRLVKLTPEVMGDESQMIAVQRKLIQLSKNEQNLRQFDAAARCAREPLWDANKLLRAVQNATAPYRANRVVYVAVTGNDIFAKKFSFLFSWASTDGSVVISYNRFRSARNGENPSWDRLLTRTVKQAICGTGRGLGIMHCSNPDCVFSGAIKLEQHDAKSCEPCEHCRVILEQKLRP